MFRLCRAAGKDGGNAATATFVGGYGRRAWSRADWRVSYIETLWWEAATEDRGGNPHRISKHDTVFSPEVDYAVSNKSKQITIHQQALHNIPTSRPGYGID